MPRRVVHAAAANRSTTFLSILILALFITLAFSIHRAHNAAVQSRHELCQANNQTRRAIRQLVDLAFAPSIAKTKDPAVRKALLEFRDQVKAPVHDLPCTKIAHG